MTHIPLTMIKGGLVADAVLRAFPTAFPDANGTQIAHDIVEHQNGFRLIGPLWDEVEAVGAMWLARPWTVHEWATNVPYFFSISPPGDTLRPLVTEPTAADDVFRYGVSHAMATLDHGDPRVRNFCRHAMSYLRTGYNKALRRFKSAERVRTHFDLIRDALAPVAGSGAPLGTRYTLIYGAGRATVQEAN